MNTTETRKKIGFPDKKEVFSKALAQFSNDGKSLEILGHPVMEDWELEYMHCLAQVVTRAGGKILEVGLGLMLAAKAIQAQNIESHYVIECHPDVIKKGVTDMREEIASSKMHILSGFWQDVSKLLASESFDGILFDPYPLSAEEIHKNHFWFFPEAFRLLKPGGTFTYYSDEATGFSEEHMQKLFAAGFKKENISFEICHVNPPLDCQYWQHDTIIVPIITK